MCVCVCVWGGGGWGWGAVGRSLGRACKQRGAATACPNPSCSPLFTLATASSKVGLRSIFSWLQNRQGCTLLVASEDNRLHPSSTTQQAAPAIYIPG